MLQEALNNMLGDSEIGKGLKESVKEDVFLKMLEELHTDIVKQKKELENKKGIKARIESKKVNFMELKFDGIGNVVFGDEREEIKEKIKTGEVAQETPTTSGETTEEQETETTTTEQETTAEQKIERNGDRKTLALLDKVKPHKNETNQDKIKENQKEFAQKVIDISKKLNIKPNRLMWIMHKESGLNHQAVNPKSKAIGLIQFMPDSSKVNYKTINGKKYAINEIKTMSNIEQLDLVYKYYLPYKGKLKSVTDLYLATFYPAALGKPKDMKLGQEVSPERMRKIAKQNKGMNRKNEEYITAGDVTDRITKGMPSNIA